MNTLNLFDIPPALMFFLPYVGAGAIAWVAYLLGIRATPRIRLFQPNRIESFLDVKGKTRDANTVPFSSLEYRLRIAFAKIGIDASGNEEYYLMLSRVVVGAAMTVILMIIGLPFITSLVGFAAGYVFVNGWIVRTWNKTRTEMESELPSLLLRLNAILQTAPNVPTALETVAKTLRAGGPLRAWTMETAARMHSEGYEAIEAIRESAAGMSTSLSIAAELVGRMWTTGGEGYSKAFGTAAENLESVLDARVLARAKGVSAQGTVNILTVMTFGMIAFMTRSSAMANVVRMPIVQVMYAVIALVIVYGHSQVSNIIDSAV